MFVVGDPYPRFARQKDRAYVFGPRIVEALNLGGCVVTEECVGLRELFPYDVVVSASYRDLSQAVFELLADEGRMRQLEAHAHRHMAGTYGDMAADSWAVLLSQVPRTSDSR